MTSRFRTRRPPPAAPPAPDPATTSKTNTKGYRDATGKFWSSKAEYNFYEQLRALESAGRVRNIQCQHVVRYDLYVSYRPSAGGDHDPKFWKHASLRADFLVCLFDGRIWQDRVIEVKGWATDEYKDKRSALALLGVIILEVPANDWTDTAIARRDKRNQPAPTYW